MKNVWKTIAVIALAFSMLGCSTKEETKKEEKTEFNINEIATIEGVEYSVTAVERHQGKSEFVKPKEGKEFVSVTVKIENKSEEKISYNPLNWKMVNGNGQEETYSVMGGDSATSLHSGDLTANGVITGSITFEQTIGDTALKLNLYETMFNETPDCSFIIK